jgi:hypothetical protein
VRPRLIQSVPGLDPTATPFERFERFARLIAAVPKTELEKESKKSARGIIKVPRTEADEASVRVAAKRAGKKREECRTR